MAQPTDTEREIEMIIEYAMKFPMGRVIRRYMEKNKLSKEVAQKHEIELKRFLALSAITGKSYPMGQPVDELWHEFILSTRKYAMFCFALTGNMIHHYPGQRDPERVSVMKDTFKQDYLKHFGVPPDSELWPLLAYCEGDCDNGISCVGDPDTPT